MRNLIIPAVASLLACGGKQSPTATPAPTSGGNMGSPQGLVTYKCDGGSRIRATYSANSVRIHWNGRAYPLTRDPVASGDTVYRGGALEWRQSGRKADLVERGRRVAIGCEPR